MLRRSQMHITAQIPRFFDLKSLKIWVSDELMSWQNFDCPYRHHLTVILNEAHNQT